MARIAIVTAGTRGDVQPMLALALSLQRRGHEVRFLVNSEYAAWARRPGLDVRVADEAPAGAIFADVASRTLRLPWPLGTVREILRHKPGVSQQLDAIERFARGASAIVCSEASSLALHVACGLSVPCLHVRLFPAWPTTRFPAPVLPLGTLGPTLNRWSHVAYSGLLGHALGSDVNRWRAARGVKPWSFLRPHREVERMGWPVALAMSAALVPASDWPPNLEVTGPWFLDEDGDLEPAVQRVLERRDLPVVAVSLGSTVGPKAERAFSLLRDAVGALPCTFLVTGAPPLDAARWPDRVMWVGAVPHHALFPRMAAVIHHAGAGTTAQAVRAAKPSVTIPMHGEQRFWARRLTLAGLGPPPLDWRRATSDALRRAVERVLEGGGYDRALGDASAYMKRERGVARGVELLEGLLSSNRGASCRASLF